MGCPSLPTAPVPMVLTSPVSSPTALSSPVSSIVQATVVTPPPSTVNLLSSCLSLSDCTLCKYAVTSRILDKH